jgi:hypothetical protein
MSKRLDADERIAVQNAGFMCHIAMHSKLDVPHETAFGVISDPDNARLFRNIDVRSSCEV